MSKHADENAFMVQTEVPEDVPATDPIVTPDTPPVEASPTEPVPSAGPTEPEDDPSEDTGKEPPVEESVIEPSTQPPAQEQPDSEGDKPIESIPVGSVAERAVTFASKIDDENVRIYVLHALADQRAFSKDWDVRYRLETANIIREMMRWIRTNVPASVSYQTFMAALNNYLLKVETDGIPSMWSKESASAPLDEIQARKAAMAIERAAEQLSVYGAEDPEKALKRYAQKIREGKIR